MSHIESYFVFFNPQTIKQHSDGLHFNKGNDIILRTAMQILFNFVCHSE